MSGSATPVVAFLAFVMSFVGAGVLTRLNVLPDRPNQRSMHTKITPRSGGIALLLPFLGSLLIFTVSGGWSEQLAAVLAGAALFSLIGLVDDAVQLSALVRLILQITGASALCWFAGPRALEIFDVVVLSGPACFAFQVGWICLAVNFFNFMDGMDGLAGVQAFFFALSAGIMILVSGQESPALGKSLLCLASSILGFLCWNLRPSTLFMGDSGSYLLGFIIGFLPLVWGPPVTASRPFELRPQQAAGGLDFTFGVILFAPFLLDAGFTVMRRLSEGQNIFVAHRSHLYQLMRSRLSTAVVLAIYASLCALFSLVAVAREVSDLSGGRSAAAAVLVVVVAGFIYSGLVRRLRAPSSPAA